MSSASTGRGEKLRRGSLNTDDDEQRWDALALPGRLATPTGSQQPPNRAVRPARAGDSGGTRRCLVSVGQRPSPATRRGAVSSPPLLSSAKAARYTSLVCMAKS